MNTSSPTADSAKRQPSPTELEELEALLFRNRLLDAWELCQPLAPIEKWQSTPALIVAGRLTDHWGNGALSNRLHQKAYRENPEDLTAARFHALSLLSKHGDFEALIFTKRITEAIDLESSAKPVIYLYALHARLLGGFRDFERAEKIFDALLHRVPGDPKILLDKAQMRRAQDRYDDALALIQIALKQNPGYGAALHAKAQLLQLLNRENEAIQHLRESVATMQSGHSVQLLALMLEETGDFEEIPALLDLAEKYLPTPSISNQRWIASRRFLSAHCSNAREDAVKWAKLDGSAYYKRIAEHLEKAEGPNRRVHLPVGFVRQHHMTCAPATLAAICEFWGAEIDHLEIARKICYDGSPDHVERDWAETHGWVVREFRPTWESTRALIDRGCPFTLSTVESESAHMQAVIGYDATIGTVIIRDPYHRTFTEWLAPEFLTSYASHGPRAMLLLPPEKQDLIEDITLDDAPLYDLFYRIRKALHQYDRPAAESAAENLRESAPDHLLTLWGNYEISTYDGRQIAALASVREIRALHPKNYNWHLIELRLQQNLEDQSSYEKLLEELGSPRNALFALKREYAENLTQDARHHRRAERMLRALLRRQAREPKNLHAYANLMWKRGDFVWATEIYRLAACCADKVEYHWDSYFSATRHLGDPSEVLAALAARVARLGDQSSLPSRTLFNSLDALDRTDEGLTVLDNALERRVDDGELMLFAAEAYGRVGKREKSAKLLEDARTQIGRYRWLLSAAYLSDLRREHATSLNYYQEIVELNPAYINGHSASARLLKVTQGNEAALQYLRQACQTSPRLVALRELLIQELRTAAPEQRLEAINEMLAMTPENAWALREKALILVDLRQLKEALDLADQALDIAPYAPSSHGIRGDVLIEQGATAEAHESYRKAITLSIDADWLFEPFVKSSRSFEDRVASITFIHAELQRQNSLENACLKFREIARTIIKNEELTVLLESYHANNPEVWAAWSAFSTHLLEIGDHERALEIAKAATEKFPLTPRAWTDKAAIHASRHETAAQIDNISKALEINPNWSFASRQLSQALETTLDLEAAAHALRRAVIGTPQAAINHGWLADIYWRQSKHDEAIAAIETAVSLSPDYSWAWNRLRSWSETKGNPDRAETLAESLTQTRAGEPDSWIRLVRMRFAHDDPEENLKALDRAAELNPFDTEIWDLRAQLLSKHGRYEEAVEACRPKALAESPSHFLEGRAAWVEYERGAKGSAIKQLQAVVDEHPDFVWGWSQLTEWYWAEKDWKGLKTAAEKWAWLAPEIGTPHGYLATCHQEANDREKTKNALETAVRLDPQYDFGVAELLKLYLEDKEFDLAEKIHRHYETHYSRGDALEAEIRIHLAKGNEPKVIELLRSMAMESDALSTTLQNSIKFLFQKKWSAVVEKAMIALITDDSGPTSASEHWVRARQQRDLRWNTFLKLFTLKANDRHWPLLLETYIDWIGTDKERVLIRLSVRWWRKRLRKHNSCWGIVGFAYTGSSLFRHTISWMNDWNQRPEPPDPWMLHNLVLSLNQLDRRQEIVRVTDFALTRPADYTHHYHMTWRAFAHALSGETDAARSLIERISPAEDWSNLYRSLLELSNILVELQSLPDEQRNSGSVNALRRLRAAVEAHPTLNQAKGLRNLYFHTLHRIGKDSGRRWLMIRAFLRA